MRDTLVIILGGIILACGAVVLLVEPGDTDYAYTLQDCSKPCHPKSFGDWPTEECNADY